MSEPPPPPPYGAYPGGYPPPPPQPYSGFAPPPTGPRNGLGIAALVIAIIGLVFCWTVAGGVILGLIAVIIGFVAQGRVKRGEATNGGVAIAGIVLGFLAIIVSLIFIPIWIGVFATRSAGRTTSTACPRPGPTSRRSRSAPTSSATASKTSSRVTITPHAPSYTAGAASA